MSDGFMGRCRSISQFKITDRIGEGTYGTVYKAEDLVQQKTVALKRVKMEKVQDAEGFPLTVLREIQILKRMTHANIVHLTDVVVGSKRDKIFLVFEYCEHDLANLLDRMRCRFTESEVKCMMKQLLLSLSYVHENWVIHRDLKLSNLLFTNEGVLKLADFGLARTFGVPARPLSPNVVTLWYRAPEVLLGDCNYGTPLDMWACGCIFAELWLQAPLLPGKTEIQQLDMTFRLLGTPNDEIWPGFSSLPNARSLKLPDYPYSNLRSVVPTLNEAGFDLLQQLLVYDPNKRLSAREALSHRFFTTDPQPKPTHLMPTFPVSNLKPVTSSSSSGRRSSSSSRSGHEKKMRTKQ